VRSKRCLTGDLQIFRALEATAVLLFLVQAVRVLFSVFFGLVYDAIFDQEVALSTLGLIVLCAIAAFLAPLAAPRRNRRALLFATALAAALARIPLTINQPTVRLWSTIAIIALAGIYAATLLRQQPRTFPTALILAFSADQFLRVAGDTYDVSLRTWWLPLQVVLSLATGSVAWLALARSPREEQPVEEGISILGGLSFGALLFLETSLLGFPNALARWTGVNYSVVAPLLMVFTLAPLMPGSPHARYYMFERKWASAVWPLLALFLLLASSEELGIFHAVGLLLFVQLPILLAFPCIAGPCHKDRTGAALALGMLLFLVLNFALAFAFTYPYTVPAFRDTGRYVFIAAVLVYLPALRAPIPKPETQVSRREMRRWIPVIAVVLLTVVFARPPAFNLKESGPLRVATYNMHYGYNTPWQQSLEEQAHTVEESSADLVILQEVDACRITSYGVDDLLWLSRRLGMQEVYAPTLEGLSGIALLSRFPISDADTEHLTSHLEQSAIVHARVQVGDRPLDVYGIWLGLEPEEQARQLDDALAYVGDASPVVFGGDFNSTPDSPIYARIQTAGFEDPFIAAGFDPAPTDPAVEPFRRIDFIWARGLEVRDARVLDSLASDHRCVVVEVTLP
jgi:endonuclease/exonuclease/phosphatase family metal-dependent hydrolase